MDNTPIDAWKIALRKMRDEDKFDDKFDTKTLEFVYAFQMGFKANNTPIEDKDLSEFLFEVKNVRNDFVRKAQDNWWIEIGVERVVFEDILIMYDQMYERLKNKEKVTNEELAKEYADSMGYQSDKEHYETTPWTEWNIRFEAYKAALQKQPSNVEPIKTITIDGITYELKFLRNAYDQIDEPQSEQK